MKQEFRDNLPPGSVVSMSDSGYITIELFRKFLEHFVTHKPQGKNTNLLVLDGHSTHVSDPDILQFVVDNNIIMISIPPHTSLYIQPLDRSFFRSLKMYYYAAVFHSKNTGEEVIKQMPEGCHSYITRPHKENEREERPEHCKTEEGEVVQKECKEHIKGRPQNARARKTEELRELLSRLGSIRRIPIMRKTQTNLPVIEPRSLLEEAVGVCTRADIDLCGTAVAPQRRRADIVRTCAPGLSQSEFNYFLPTDMTKTRDF
ncbi:hypothetical protein PR048_018724 [Dryococelus australis]|uniref:DDE-1 domain-containing protein n=1 Tax=Dryococelus australis TaxID=614101 RepID=A0ABQ9HD79_9NEOP|nr:hypothetical protein PR048_018724 [Dryococelus australis]